MNKYIRWSINGAIQRGLTCQIWADGEPVTARQSVHLPTLADDAEACDVTECLIFEERGQIGRFVFVPENDGIEAIADFQGLVCHEIYNELETL